MKLSNHIENSDRGLTISKSLAWTMVTGLVLAGIWVGVEIGSIRSSLENVNASLEEATSTQARLSDRVRDVEAYSSGARVQTDSIVNGLDRIERRLESIDDRLREQENNK